MISAHFWYTRSNAVWNESVKPKAGGLPLSHFICSVLHWWRLKRYGFICKNCENMDRKRCNYFSAIFSDDHRRNLLDRMNYWKNIRNCEVAIYIILLKRLKTIRATAKGCSPRLVFCHHIGALMSWSVFAVLIYYWSDWFEVVFLFGICISLVSLAPKIAYQTNSRN